MENLDFQSGDVEALKKLCLDSRKFCKNNPAHRPEDAFKGMSSDFRFGSWNMLLTYEAYHKNGPKWHASAAILEEVGTSPQQLPSGLIVELPQEAMLSLTSWTPEHHKQADFLLTELIGNEDKSKQQTGMKFEGLFALHYILEAA